MLSSISSMIFDNIENKISIEKIKKEINNYHNDKINKENYDNELLIKYIEKYEKPRAQQEETIRNYLEERTILYKKWKNERTKQSLYDLINLIAPDKKYIPDIYTHKLLSFKDNITPPPQKEKKIQKPKEEKEIKPKEVKPKEEKEIKPKQVKPKEDKPKDVKPKDVKEKKVTKKVIIQNKSLEKIGFPNLGNSCYINSGLQLLFKFNKLNDIILSSSSSVPLILKYIHLYNSYLNKSVNGTDIKELINELNNRILNESDKIDVTVQSDCSEFVIKLMSHIIDILKIDDINNLIDVKTSTNIDLQSVTKYNKEYKCIDEKNERIEIENGIIITNIKKEVNIATELNKLYNGDEELIKSKDNLYKCEKIIVNNKLSDKDIKFPFVIKRKVINYPEILKINLNIFNFSGSGNKIFAKTLIPNIWEHNNNKYSLKGMVVHIGENLNSGHYKYFSNEDNKWYEYSDNNIIVYEEPAKMKKHYYKLSVNDVTEFNSKGDIPTPYIIYYNKI